MGTIARPFLRNHEDKVNELKRNFLIYVKTLRAPGVLAPDSVKAMPHLTMTEDGFPVMPTLWQGSTYRKKDLEHFFTEYIVQHYRMNDLPLHLIFNDICV